MASKKSKGKKSGSYSRRTSGRRSSGRRSKSGAANKRAAPQTVRVVVEQVAATPQLSPPQQVLQRMNKRQF